MAKHENKVNKGSSAQANKAEPMSEADIAKLPEGARIPEEATPAIDMPAPTTEIIPLSELPDPRLHPEMNLRAKPTVAAGESIKDAVIRQWKVGPLIEAIKAGAPNTIPPIYLAEWDSAPDIVDLETGGKVPAFEFTVNGKKVWRATPDGNRRSIAVLENADKYPNGVEITLHDAGPKGEIIERKVLKTFTSIPALVYRGMTPTQYHHLQLISGNRKQFDKGDICDQAMQYILQRPTAKNLEKLTVQHVQPENVAICTKAKDPHGWFQECQRAALMTADLRRGFVDYRNNVKGVKHPSPDDLRAIYPHFKLEVISYENNEIKPGVFWDPKFNLRTATMADLEGVWKMWTPEKCTAAADRAEKRADARMAEAARLEAEALEMSREDKAAKAGSLKLEAENVRTSVGWLRMTATKLRAGATPDKLSETLNVFKGMATRPTQNKKVGTMLEAKDLGEVKGEFFQAQCPVAALFTDTTRGAKGAPEKKTSVDLSIRFERRAWELLDAHAPKEAEAFRAELEKLQPLGE